jgi:uncharacterized membrane protein HdeD (DUF308 family)
MTDETPAVKNNSLATVSLVLGLAGILGFFLQGGVIAAIIGIAAIMFGVIALIQIKKEGEKGKSNAIFGIILGFLPVLFVVFLAIMGPVIGQVFQNVIDGMQTQ